MKIRKTSVITAEADSIREEHEIRAIIDDFHKEVGYFKVIGVMKRDNQDLASVLWIDSAGNRQISVKDYSVKYDPVMGKYNPPSKWTNLYWELVEVEED